MTNDEKKRLQQRKDVFLKEMSRKHEMAEESVIRLLKAWNISYNEKREGEIDQVLGNFVKRQIEQKRDALRTKIMATPQSDPCWLHAVEGINCEGTIHRNGGLPECSIGGVRHFLASRHPNPLALLRQVETVSKERNRIREEELRAWKEGMARPFNIGDYQISLKVVQDEFDTI